MIQAKKINYKTDAVSQEVFDVHIQLYHGYCKKVNEIYNRLQRDSGHVEANKNFSQFRSLKKELSYNLDSVILHEMYFKNLGKKDESKPSQVFIDVTRPMGGYEYWQKDFIATAKSARGFCIAAYEQRTGRLQNVLLDSYSDGLILNMFPLVLVDVYEHAYSDHLTDIDKYLQNVMQSLCWNTINRRMEALNG